MNPADYRPARVITGPTYSRGFKVVATLMTLALAALWVWVLFLSPNRHNAGAESRWILSGFLALLLATWWFFMRSTVTIDADGLRQTWFVDKKVRWSEIRSARLFGIPGLQAVVPPRLMLRTSGSPMLSFPGGTRELLTEYARIAVAFDPRLRQ